MRKKSPGRSRPTSVSVVDLPTETISPSDVRLDPKNPRLAPEERGSSAQELLEIMIRRFKIDEVARSIIARGYIPFDPLIGWNGEDGITIREGNRRIAALKLLLNPDLAPPKHRDRWKLLSKESEEVKDSFEKVEIKLVGTPTDGEVLAYIGFRHISGTLQWPAFEKAAFISNLIDDEKWNYRDVARQIGSRADATERHYVAYKLVQQSENLEPEAAENMQASFGVLMRALNSPGVRTFIGLEYPDDPRKSRKPAKNKDNLGDFARWTFGTEDEAPILQDSRQLTEWGRMLSSSKAIAYLRTASRPRFERAQFKAGGDQESVVDSLIGAAERLEEALPHMKQYKDDAEIEELVGRSTYFLVQILEHFPDTQDKYGVKIEDV